MENPWKSDLAQGALSPPDDRHVGWRDLTVWKSQSGKRVAALTSKVAAKIGPHKAIGLTLLGGAGAAVVLSHLSAEIYEQVGDGDGFAGFDRPVQDYFLGIRTERLNRYVGAYTQLGGVVGMPVLATSIATMLSVKLKRWTPIVLSIAAGSGSAAMTVAGKAVVGRARPPLEEALPPHELSTSFPSGHTLNAVVLTGTITYLVLRHQQKGASRALTVSVATVFAGTMGATRVYLGHHWLTDVLVAWTLGLAWLSIVITGHRLHLTIQRHRAAGVLGAELPVLEKAVGDDSAGQEGL